MNLIKWLFGEKAPQATARAIPSSQAQALLRLLNDFFETNGGLAGVVRRFEQSGYQSKVRSWVSTGANQPINSVEVLQLLGLPNLSEMAEKSGIPIDALRHGLAELLPVAIDRATPAGRL